MCENYYPENFLVLGNEILGVLRDGELARPCGSGRQEVVVDPIVAAESDEDEGLVHSLLRLSRADERA